MTDILLVDDNIVLTTVLEEFLPSLGHNVVGTAHSGDRAIVLAKRLRPDLVLMDIVMPGQLDGIAAAEILKRDLDIPVIFISTHTDKDYLERAEKVGPLGYIHKPFSGEQIMATIEMAVYRRNSEKDQSHQLNRTNDLLEIQSVKIEELGAALKLLMDYLGEDRTQVETNLVSRLTEHSISLLEKVKESSQGIQQRAVIDAVEAIVGNVVTPFLRRLPPEYHDFTLSELRVAALLKEGKTSKEVAEALNLDPSTVIWHRKRIRKKLGISGDTTEKIIDHLPTIE